MKIYSCTTQRISVSCLAIVLSGLLSTQSFAADVQQVDEQANPAQDEEVLQQLMPFEVVVSRNAHFSAPDGADMQVPPGIYVVEQVADAQLRLVPGDGDPIVVAASKTEHEEQLDDLLALSEQVEDDEFHVVLLLPDATAFDAAATFSGVTTRGTRQRILRKDQIRQARTRYKQQSAASQGATSESKKAKSRPRKYVVPGTTFTHRFEKPPEVNAYGARLVDPKTRQFIPKNIASASVKRGVARKKKADGQYVKVPFVKVTVKTTRNFRHGNYQLWLLDKNGRPLRKASNQATRKSVRVAPLRLTSVASNHPAVQQQSTKVAATAGQQGRTQFSGNVADPGRDASRANQVMDKLGHAGLENMPGLEPGSLAGSGLLLGFGDDLHAGFIGQLGEFPDGEFTGILGGVDGGQGAGTVGGGRFQPNTGDPSKDASFSQSGGSVGDPRLMSGGSSSGGTFTIESSSYDYESSNGTQKVTDSIKVTNDDGSTFEHTMSQETREDGSTTETQKATSTDENGNTTSEETTTETDSEGNETTTTTSTDEKGNTTTDTTTTPASGTDSTPDPEGGDCTGQQCEEFKAFTEAFMFSLAHNRIENQQTDPGSMMQPGEGTTTPGGRSNATLDKAAEERLNPYILHDNAGDSSIPMPAGMNAGPQLDVKGSLTDPPRGGGSMPYGDGSQPGGDPIQRGTSPDPATPTEEAAETGEAEATADE